MFFFDFFFSEGTAKKHSDGYLARPFLPKEVRKQVGCSALLTACEDDEMVPVAEVRLAADFLKTYVCTGLNEEGKIKKSGKKKHRN